MYSFDQIWYFAFGVICLATGLSHFTQQLAGNKNNGNIFQKISNKISPTALGIINIIVGLGLISMQVLNSLQVE